jgi:hypothetical protein
MIQRLRNGNIRIVDYKDARLFIMTFATYEKYASWKKSVLALMMLALFQCCAPAHAEDMSTERIAAHIGMSYMLTDVTAMFGKQAFHMSNLQAETFAAFTTIFVGVVYKGLENASVNETLRSTGYNTIGIGTHALFHLSWEF